MGKSMGDMGDFYKDLKEHKKAYLKGIISIDMDLLNNCAEISYTAHNFGEHLILKISPVSSKNCFLVDYWPSSRKWATRTGIKGKGIQNLFKYFKLPSPNSVQFIMED